MPGRSSTTGSVAGLIVAVVAVVGWLLFDWDFGADDGVVPLVIGVAAATVAIGTVLYRRVLKG